MNEGIVAVYDYRDESGELLYQNCRFEPKTFRQRRPDGNGGWTWNLNGTRRVLYRLRELLQANLSEPVFFVEGEKDCDNVRSLGLVATTSGAVHSWRQEFAEFLNDRHVVILPDNDEPGQKCAERVKADLIAASCPNVKVVRLPDLPCKGDVTDWIEAGGNKEKLLGLINRQTDKVKCRPFSEIKPQQIDYLIPEILPVGFYVSVISQEGVGKSTLAGYWAALISNGTDTVPQGDVVIFSPEESAEQVISNRLAANRADMSRVHIGETVILSGGEEAELDVEHHINVLDRMADEMPGLRLIVFDPITAFITSNENSNCEVRKALRPLVDFAARRKITILALTHLNKKVDLSFINRSIGSRSWSAVPRLIWGIRPETIEGENGQNTETNNRFLLCIKNNLGPKPQGMKFSIGDGGAVVFEARRYDLNMEDGGMQASRKNEIGDWLCEQIGNDTVPAAEIIAKGCLKWGISRQRLGKTAKDAGISKRFSGTENCWVWSVR